MMRRPTISTRTYTLFPYPARFRAGAAHLVRAEDVPVDDTREVVQRHRDRGPQAGVERQDRDLAVAVDLQRERQRSVHQSRTEEHTSELQSLMRISYAVFCLKKKIQTRDPDRNTHSQ